MRKLNLFIFAASAAALTGCGTTTTIYDPATTKHQLRQERTVSSEEFREVAVIAVQRCMQNPKFKSFLKKYKTEKNDPDAIPVVKLDRLVNDTDDPDLNTAEMTDMITEALLNSGLVDVTLAEGHGKTQSIASSRELKNDANFDQSTVAGRNTLQAARIIMRPKVISNTISDGNTKAVARTFVLEMVDVRTGLLMFKFTHQLGFMKKKGTFGW